MSIQSFALKTITLIALISVPLPATTQSPSTNQATKDAGKVIVTSQTATVATTVVLTISTASTISYGEDVGGYALVTSSDGTTLSGTVTFYDGATNICTIPVTQTTSCPAGAGTGFVAGTHMLTAAYSGDSTHQGSISNGVPILVVPDITTLSLSSSANPVGYGSNVMFTVAAQGDHAIPSGQVQFLDGTSLIATATLSPAGTATVAESALKLGTHPITARYAATQNFGAASTVLNQIIQTSAGMATLTMLASNLNPATEGQSITFTANAVTVGQSLVPTGTVTFLDGSTVLGTASLNSSGLATLSTSSLESGNHSISASYAGSTATAASSSTPLTETVSASSTTSPAPFTVAIAGTPTVITGQSVNLLVTVAPRVGSPQPVQLSCSGLPAESACTFGTAALPANGGTTSLQISTMAPHSCQSDIPYSQNAGIPFAGPALAGLMLLFIPRRRRKSIKNLLMVLVAACCITSLMGCGNCSDLGTRPGDYAVQVIASSTGAITSKVITKITLHVTVP
jgi:hypothetical protein